MFVRVFECFRMFLDVSDTYGCLPIKATRFGLQCLTGKYLS